MRVNKLTITGLDHATQLTRANDLAQANLGLLEFGVLFGEKESPRYPNAEIRAKITEAFGGELASGYRLAAHLCGNYAHRSLDFNDPLQKELRSYNAVQFNVNLDKISKIAFYNLLSEVNDSEYSRISEPILQWNANNAPYLEVQYRGRLLVDNSGGEGKELNLDLVHPGFLKKKGIEFGFAGGFTPDNILNKLYDIEKYLFYYGHSEIAVNIDVESGVRNKENLLDLDKAEDFLGKIKEFNKEREK